MTAPKQILCWWVHASPFPKGHYTYVTPPKKFSILFQWQPPQAIYFSAAADLLLYILICSLNLSYWISTSLLLVVTGRFPFFAEFSFLKIYPVSPWFSFLLAMHFHLFFDNFIAQTSSRSCCSTVDAPLLCWRAGLKLSMMLQSKLHASWTEPEGYSTSPLQHPWLAWQYGFQLFCNIMSLLTYATLFYTTNPISYYKGMLFNWPFIFLFHVCTANLFCKGRVSYLFLHSMLFL